jgi:hypothetical protein
MDFSQKLKIPRYNVTNFCARKKFSRVNPLFSDQKHKSFLSENQPLLGIVI